MTGLYVGCHLDGLWRDWLEARETAMSAADVDVTIASAYAFGRLISELSRASDEETSAFRERAKRGALV